MEHAGARMRRDVGQAFLPDGTTVTRNEGQAFQPDGIATTHHPGVRWEGGILAELPSSERP